MNFFRTMGMPGILIAAASSSFAASDPACKVAADAAAWAREMTPEMAKDKDTLKQLLLWLGTGTERCTSFPSVAADAWYYRALIQRAVDGGESKDPTTARKEELWKKRAIDGGSLVAKEACPLGGCPKAEVKPVAGQVREKFAIVVGISEFASKDVPTLRYPAKDASGFAAVLEDANVGRFKPENVSVLLNKDATLVNIRKALGKIRAQAKPDDLVVLFISSHGSPRVFDPRGISYVVTYDTDISGADTIYATGLAMSEIVSTLNRDVEAQRVVLLLDTCFAGGAAPGAKSLVPVGAAGANAFSGAVAQFNATGWAVIAGSRGDQQSWESDELQHGYFTYYLVDALRKTGGKAPLDDVFQRLRDAVSAGVRKEHAGFDQTPVMSSGADGAKLTLGVEPHVTQAMK